MARQPESEDVRTKTTMSHPNAREPHTSLTEPGFCGTICPMEFRSNVSKTSKPETADD
ncbi:hypothetical protein RvY_13043 [Ramazzottius varieornatus]|uniref:Uncharacterized protein n=1 Tax=Ramazzottius varieornatus TaxID=947166 RepID=A0A1D1VLJ2_RAMVA|nr:hypothetical protein RvY_13043 [Ramazzottius varieornatus]